MTTETHEYFTRSVSHEILKQFQELAGTVVNRQLAEYLEHIQDGGSSRLYLADLEPNVDTQTPTAYDDDSARDASWGRADAGAAEILGGDSEDETIAEVDDAQADADEDEDLEEDEEEAAAEEAQSEFRPAQKRRNFKCPDAQFARIDVLPPFLVLEVAFSQKRKDLPHLAEWYIISSKAQITTVVGFDIAYQNRKNTSDRGNQEAKVFIYQPAQKTDEKGELCGYAKEVWKSIFRTHSGKPGRGELKLYLRDMLPTKFFPEGSADNELAVSLSIAKLKLFLDNAEKQHATALAAQDPSPPRKGWESVKWESRKRSPEQDLRQRDEKKFRRQEDEAQRREDKVDGLVRRPSGSLSLPESSITTRSKSSKAKGAG